MTAEKLYVPKAVRDDDEPRVVALIPAGRGTMHPDFLLSLSRHRGSLRIRDCALRRGRAWLAGRPIDSGRPTAVP